VIFPTSDEERDVEHFARRDRIVIGHFHRSIPEAIEVGKTAEAIVVVFSPLRSVQLAKLLARFGFGSQENDLPVGMKGTVSIETLCEERLLLRSVWAVLLAQSHVDVVRVSHVSESSRETEVDDGDDFPGEDVLPELLVNHREVLESRNERDVGVDGTFDREELVRRQPQVRPCLW
jgi:hypothetical protein